MFPDEFATVPDGDGLEAATQSVTKSRIFNSTHKGAGTTFYRLSLKPSIKKLSLHWSLHPIYNKGLYYADKDGKMILLDDTKRVVTVSRIDYNFPDEYPFRLDGKLRSPWYDNECDRASHPMIIAQELDMDPFASDFQFFDGNVIAEIDKEDVRPPYHEGMLEYDEDSLEPLKFIEGKNGFMKLWIHPDAYGKFSSTLRVGCGIDVGAGTGASNSAASFINLDTGEKIAEYANPWIKPEAFASVAYAMCMWFNEAYVIWDASGTTGQQFGPPFVKLGYRNIFYRRDEEKISKTISDKPGFFITAKTKAPLLGAYRKALKDRTFIQRSYEANQECLFFVFTTGNEIEHSASTNSVDPSGAKANHGDRTTADALANKTLDIMSGGVRRIEKEDNPNCWAGRKKAHEQKLKKEKEW